MSESGPSLLEKSRRMPHEAVIELNDVFGPVDGPRLLDDVDAEVETTVGNEGRFLSGKFKIDAWPDACIHLATHIAEVREDQIQRLKDWLGAHGYDPEISLTEETISEIQATDYTMGARGRSVGRHVIKVVMNHANRLQESEGENGAAFYAGFTGSGLIFYSQKRYLQDLLRDGRITELYRIKNKDNGGLWVNGHQFRSSVVANAQSYPDSLEPVIDLSVPEQDAPLEIVWIDKFGNSLLRARDPENYTELLVPGRTLTLVIDGKPAKVVVGTDLDNSETGQPTIYRNPNTTHPRIIDLAIKSQDCLSGRGHALEFIRKRVGNESLALKDLRKLELDLEA